MSTVQKARLRAWFVGAGVLSISAIFLLGLQGSRLPGDAITARYVDGKAAAPAARSAGDQFTSVARIASGTLWVTNNTQKWLGIEITGIEVWLGNAWTNYPSDFGTLGCPRFPVGNGIYSTVLPPRAAAFGQMQRFSAPETSPWRLNLRVSEELHGPRYVWAGVRAFLATLVHDRRFENPFPKGLGYRGQPRNSVSEETNANHANNTVSTQ